MYTKIYLALLLSVVLGWQVRAQTKQFNELVWSDEFEGEGLPNPAKWGYDLGHGHDGWGNHELQAYTNEVSNVRQTGGKLVIDALKKDGKWTSARVKTQGKFAFTHGRVEFRAKLPTGVGSWPALWMLGANIKEVGWPSCGEIDVMEYAHKNPGRVQAAMHTPASHGNTQDVGATMVPDATTAFHTYAAEWTEEAIKFFVDDKLYYTYAPAVKDARTWPLNHDFFLIMNIAIGGGFGSEPSLETGGMKNGVDPALSHARMEVDYVRVYQPFKELTLTGPTPQSGAAGTVLFTTNRLPNATYSWSLPTGAVLLQGQGTPEVQVNWGKASGKVKVKVNSQGQTYTKTMKVKLKPNLESSKVGLN